MRCYLPPLETRDYFVATDSSQINKLDSNNANKVFLMEELNVTHLELNIVNQDKKQ